MKIKIKSILITFIILIVISVSFNHLMLEVTINKFKDETLFIENDKFVINLDGKLVELELTDDFISIKDSYKLNYNERIKVLSKIKKIITTDRSIRNLEAELAMHNMSYKIGLFKKETKDTELEFQGDPRWYVRIATIVFQVLGI